MTISTRSLLLVLGLAITGCAGPGAPRSTAQAPAVTPAKDPATARALIAAGSAVVLDVRTADEYGGGHLAGAVNLPVQELPARIAEVDTLVAGDRGRPVVVYCAAGGRAAKAKAALEAAGYTHVVNGGSLADLQ